MNDDDSFENEIDEIIGRRNNTDKNRKNLPSPVEASPGNGTEEGYDRKSMVTMPDNIIE